VPLRRVTALQRRLRWRKWAYARKLLAHKRRIECSDYRLVRPALDRIADRVGRAGGRGRPMAGGDCELNRADRIPGSSDRINKPLEKSAFESDVKSRTFRALRSIQTGGLGHETSCLLLRVSTVDQTTANQERELREVASRMGLRDRPKSTGITASAALRAATSVPHSTPMCRDATKRQFDVVMAWSVDRLGRSLQDLVAFLSEISRAPRRSLPASAGPRHHHARLARPMFQMMGVFCRV